MKSILESPYRIFFLGGLFVFLVTSYFSLGYNHPDEHFQLLEFANYKLGKSPATDLPWEFESRIRPALQPAIAYGVIKLLTFLHITSPLTWTLVLRLISGILAWWVISKMILLFLRDFSSESGKKIFVFNSLCLWFVPFLFVRFSSECYSGISFLLATYLIITYLESPASYKIFRLVFAGLLLGLSFYFRFQIAFAIIGLACWLLFIQKIKWKLVPVILIPCLLAMGLSTFIDFWFYGEWAITPWNYFKVNIVEDKASYFGVRPWYYYFIFLINETVLPLGIVLLTFFFSGILKRPKHVLFWCLIPFLIGHFLIGHKELRFMHPMIFSFIYFVSLGIDAFISQKKYLKAGRILLVICLLINIPMTLIIMIRPAREAVTYYKFLQHYTLDRPIDLLCVKRSVYEIANLPLNFYKSDNVNCIILPDTTAAVNYILEHRPDSIYRIERELYENLPVEGYQLTEIYNYFPKWILHFNFNHWVERTRVWNIRKLKKSNLPSESQKE